MDRCRGGRSSAAMTARSGGRSPHPRSAPGADEIAHRQSAHEVLGGHRGVGIDGHRISGPGRRQQARGLGFGVVVGIDADHGHPPLGRSGDRGHGAELAPAIAAPRSEEIDDDRFPPERRERDGAGAGEGGKREAGGNRARLQNGRWRGLESGRGRHLRRPGRTADGYEDHEADQAGSGDSCDPLEDPIWPRRVSCPGARRGRRVGNLANGRPPWIHAGHASEPLSRFRGRRASTYHSAARSAGSFSALLRLRSSRSSGFSWMRCHQAAMAMPARIGHSKV